MNLISLIPPFARKRLKQSRKARLIAARLRHDESLLTWSSMLRPGMTVIDVGAFVGEYTFIASHTVGPAGHVYAVEPFPPSYRKLEDSVLKLKHSNVTTMNFATSDKTATLTMQIGEDHISNSLHVQGTESIEVKASTIDDLIPAANVDLMKIDVEGHELYALMGMDRFFNNNPGIILFIEFNPSVLAAAKTEVSTLIDYLHDRGLHCYFPIERHPSQICRFNDSDELMRALPDTGATNVVACRQVPEGLTERNGMWRAIKA